MLQDGHKANKNTASDDVQSLATSVMAGNRRSLAKAITLVESEHPQDRRDGHQLLSALGERRDSTLRIGVTGIPGVGKSTFIEALGGVIADQGRRLAILTVDPSSRRSGGSILGDKTRMEKLTARTDVYIRPSPSGLTLGGVARSTHDVITVCEAAGFDVVIVETVGVGQSEVSVADMTDIFLLLLSPSGGDELQGIKRGIVEVADLLVVNKADGDLLAAAERTAAEYSSALRLVRGAERAQESVQMVSALYGQGIDLLWRSLMAFEQEQRTSDSFVSRRATQSVERLWHEVNAQLFAAVRKEPSIVARLESIESRVRSGQLSVTVAAAELVREVLDANSANMSS